MLRTRVLSGILLGLSLVCGILFLENAWVAIFLGVLFLVGAEEWASLTSLRTLGPKSIYVLLVGALMWLLYHAPHYAPGNALFWLATVLWLGITIALLGYRRKTSSDVPRWQFWLRSLGLILIPAAWLAMVELHEEHSAFLLYLFALCAATDTLAYFSGKAFGRVPLAPELSPGKTREGFFGGLLGGLAVTLAFIVYMQMPAALAIPFIALSLVCSAISVSGDLFESLIKREAGAKDSGWIIPGHGGVLDRFDSHIAAAPVFVIGLQLISGISLYG